MSTWICICILNRRRIRVQDEEKATLGGCQVKPFSRIQSIGSSNNGRVFREKVPNYEIEENCTA